MYKERTLAKQVLELSSQFKVLLITGARQVGIAVNTIKSWVSMLILRRDLVLHFLLPILYTIRIRP